MKTIAAMLFLLTTLCPLGQVRAAEEPTPIARYTYDPTTCHKRIRNMRSMIKYWSPEILRVHNYFLYDAKIMPYWEFTGDMYYYGCPKGELPVDKATAARWYQSAAMEFVPTAQYKLGRMMLEGDGIPINVEGGRAWMTSAALEGSIEAAQYLAGAGLPVPQPIYPTSYTVAMREAKAELEAGQARDRAAIVSDLSNLLVNVASIYVAASVASQSAPVVRRAPAPTAMQPAYTPPVMRRPAYCNAYGTVTSSSITNTAWINVSSFCN